jgi:uncharacterized protein YodC (DUF2158 family)
MSSTPTVDAHDLSLSDLVELNSGGPPMTVIEITTPGRNIDGTDIVVWWRAEDGSPQIAEFDSRCVHHASLSR